MLEVLSGPCVEARVQQSALTQLSVMMEDPSLHKIFIEQDGVQIFTELLKTTAVLFSSILYILFKKIIGSNFSGVTVLWSALTLHRLGCVGSDLQYACAKSSSLRGFVQARS